MISAKDSFRLLVRLGAVALLLAFGAAGCAKRDLDKESRQGLAHDKYPKPPDHVVPLLRLLVWPDTITNEAKLGFENRYGVKLEIDTFRNDDEAHAKLEADPKKWDVLMVTQYMANRMRHEGRLQTVPRLNPFIYEYIDTAVINREADPLMQYFIPFDYATLGISFNVDHVAGFPRKWEYLAEHKNNPYLYGRIVMTDDMRYAMTVALLFAGRDPGSTDPRDLAAARDLLIDNVRTFGLRFLPDAEIRTEMASRGALIGITWSGEGAAILKLHPSCRFLVPEGKSIVTSDGFCIPKGAIHPESSALFIEYMLHPYVSLQTANACMYASVNLRSMNHASRFLINGPSTTLPATPDRIHMKYLTEAELDLYRAAWAEIRSVQPDLSRVIPIPVE